ncbi:MAG: HAMP domain-containing sensor histidine kinase [Elusimicrobiota bacterium]
MRLLRLILACNWKYYSFAVLAFAAFWHSFSTGSLFRQTDQGLRESVRQSAPQFEAAYLANDIFEAKRILWTIRGEHVDQLVFRSSDAVEDRVMFREVIVGDMPRMGWTQGRRSLPVVSNGAQIGGLEYSIDWLELNRSVLTRNVALFATVMVFVLGLLLLSSTGAVRTLLRMEDGISEINRLIEADELDAVRSKLEDQARVLPAGGIGQPFAELAARLVDTVQRASRLAGELRVSQAVSDMAAQVAHDIRSPLAALDAVIKDVSQLPEEKRIVVRSAVSRIRDIANDLIEKNKESQVLIGRVKKAAEKDAAPVSVELLSSHVDPVITEKRLQFRSKIGIEIDGRLDASYGLFAMIQPADFKRALSNLINNGVEAMGEKGLVAVQLMADADHILVKVSDNAKGIPRDVLVKLGQRGVTHGKAGGSGLGLYHARSCAESWGGRLTIESEEGKGTVVAMELPRAVPPEWFVPRLELPAGSSVAVLDDDASIHQIWQGRLESQRAKEHGIEVAHFSTPEGLRQFLASNSAKARAALCLVDYEFVGHKETGLGLIEELDICQRSILITSRAEEDGILAECRRLGVRMIPKGMAGFVPISIAPQHGTPDAVLLDNDTLVHMTWKIAAESKGMNLLCFRTAQELLGEAERLPKDTAIYADSELGDGVRGEDVAKELHARGFTRLYLTTGHSPDTFAPMPWISRVMGKEPPWSHSDA